MNDKLKPGAAALLALALAACATQPPADKPVQAPVATPPPAYLTRETGCAVLAGGDIGSRFDDKKVESLWQKINASITNELFDRLIVQQYKVVKLIVPVEQAADYEKVVLQTLARHRCSRLLQISHAVGEDAAGRYFRFDIALLRMQPQGERPPGATGTNTVTVGEYAQRYRYERSTAVFDSFYSGTFAQTVLADLEQRGALAPLR